MHIYHSRWHEISQEHIENLFERYLGSVTALPFPLLPELSKLEKATLEVVEDRHMSTVYLIRETGAFYQITVSGDMYGPCYSWESPEPGNKRVKAVYKLKPCVFTIAETENSHYIHRQKSPRFSAHYDPQTKEIFDLQWIDPEPFQITVISVLKKAKDFLRNRVK